jgi:long-chain acyl-CoA synthetase
MLSHRALVANLEQMAALDPAPVIAGDVVLLALPLFHVFGLNAVLGQALHAGATIVLALDPEPAAVLELVGSAGITSVAGTPEMYTAWTGQPGVREALSGVRVLVSGSAALRPAAAAAFREATGRRVWQGYGLTEAAPVVTASMRAKDGSVGRPLPGVEVRIVDRDGSEAATGDPGELWIRGANLFSGYWPDGRDAPDAAGWFATGDVGFRDAEGDLFMVSTRHDVVVVDGFTVYPREVEEVLLALPGVAEAAVVAVPDERTGQAVKTLLVPAPGAELSIEAVREFCASRLARFKVPQQVELVAELPRTVAGKIARGLLRDPSR